MKYDWNRLFQEVSTILISIGIGLYFYEKKGRDITGTGLFTEESKPYLIAGIIVIASCIAVKLAIYCSLFDANSLKTGQPLKRPKGASAIDVNGIFQEICTVLLGISIGMFTTPVVKNNVLFETTEYPDPALGITLTALCLFFKLLLYSEALDFQSKGLWHPQKIKPFLGKYDWNEFMQELTSTCIGIGVGFYMYESRVVFVLEKWFPQQFGKLREETADIWERVTRGFQGTPFEKTIKMVPDIWTNEAAKPYIMAGIVMITVCVVIKLAIYSSLWDANQLRDAMLGKKQKQGRRRILDYNGIADEVATLLLTIILGIIATPLLEGAFLEEKQGDSRYQILALCMVPILAFFKLLVATGTLEFGPPRKTASRKAEGRRK